MTDEDLDGRIKATFENLRRVKREAAAHAETLLSLCDQLQNLGTKAITGKGSDRQPGLVWKDDKLISVRFGGEAGRWPRPEDVEAEAKGLHVAEQEIDRLRNVLKEMGAFE